jgi:DNA-directed RNA polymerase specialized sigma24 family protein
LDSTDERSNEEQPPELGDASGVRGCLATSWEIGDFRAFYGTVTVELCPRIHRYLARRFRLDDDECDDCTSEILENLVERQNRDRSIIHDPYNYIFRGAINAAHDLMRGRIRDREVAEGWRDINGVERQRRDLSKGDYAGSDAQVLVAQKGVAGPSPATGRLFPLAWASLVVEEMTGEVEVEGEFAREIVQTAITRLTPSLRRVIEYVMYEDFDYKSGDIAYSAQEGATALGMTVGAFRTNKSRAFEDLRALIPQVVRELGISLRHRVAEVGIAVSRVLPSDDDPAA